MKPGHIDNPIMQIAFRDFVNFAYRTPEMLEAFKLHSGIDLAAKATPIDAMIDDATGKTEADMQKFLDWLIEFHWGAESSVDVDAATGCGDDQTWAGVDADDLREAASSVERPETEAGK